MKNGLLHILYLMAILAFHSCSHEWFDGDFFKLVQKHMMKYHKKYK